MLLASTRHLRSLLKDPHRNRHQNQPILFLYQQTFFSASLECCESDIEQQFVVILTISILLIRGGP